MMFSWYIFLAGAILGILQFGLGLWIGKIYYDRRKRQTPQEEVETATTPTQENAKRLQTVTARLQSTVHRVSSDVSNHQVRIEQMTRELNAFKKRSTSITEEVIWERLNQLLRMTTDFRNRLSEAESRLQVQGKQIDMLAQSQNVPDDFSSIGRAEDLTGIHNYQRGGIQPVGISDDTYYYPDTSESLIPDETVDCVASLGESGIIRASEAAALKRPDAEHRVSIDEETTKSGDVNLMLENVRSRLGEVIGSPSAE